jgi:hypothetical protein
MIPSDVGLFLNLPSTPNMGDIVIWELTFICFFLGAIFLALVYLLLLFVRIFKTLNQLGNQVQGQGNERQLREKIEDLLATGKAADAKRLSADWVTMRPGSIEARWLLAQSKFHIGELIEAKKEFLEVRELAPNWEVSIAPWIVRVEEKIASSGPKVIK